MLNIPSAGSFKDMSALQEKIENEESKKKKKIHL
tara:strand:- start:19 stop:120 length:102 start_codon:yes stop_codon:yes gene_type:complete